MDFSSALELLDKQIDLPEWSMVSDMLLVAEKSGGDVTGILSQVSQTLRDKYEVEEEVLTATASGRASAVIISMLAPGVFAIFYLMSPEYVLPLIQTKLGNFMLIGALILELIGVYIVHRIMKVDF
jgi:tight adherence protein B